MPVLLRSSDSRQNDMVNKTISLFVNSDTTLVSLINNIDIVWNYVVGTTCQPRIDNNSGNSIEMMHRTQWIESGVASVTDNLSTVSLADSTSGYFSNNLASVPGNAASIGDKVITLETILNDLSNSKVHFINIFQTIPDANTLQVKVIYQTFNFN